MWKKQLFQKYGPKIFKIGFSHPFGILELQTTPKEQKM